jgi:peroxidase
MAASFRDGAVVGLCLMAMVVVGSIGVEAQLSTTFYYNSCPQIQDIVRSEIRKAVAAEARMAASLVRLHFHDCFVNGCDGSILLNATDDFKSEQFSLANNNSIRGLNVIDTIKAKLEAACPGTVSCADIVAIASRDSAVEVGLVPGYPVFFGRRDSLTANQSAANQFLPGPGLVYADLKKFFAAVGLNEVDLVALSGAHTIGRVRCTIVRAFLNDTDTNAVFRERNAKICPPGVDPKKLTNLDLSTPDKFDNWYYKNLLVGEGILRSDQVLFSTPGLINTPLVAAFAFNPFAFTEQFGVSSIRMGDIKPLTGNQGEIRKNCALVNKRSDAEPAITLFTSQ